MTPYFLFLLFLLLCCFLDLIVNQKSNIYKIITFSGLTLFSGFRLNVGIDYGSYVSIFHGIEGHFVHEPGSALLFFVLNKIGGTEHLYFLLMAIITEYFVYKVLIQEKKCFWLMVFIYYCVSIFYFASFNAVRNFAAISIVIWSLRFVKSGQFNVYAVIIVAVTLTFHYSAFFFLPLYLFLRSHPSIKEIMIIAIAIFIAGNIIFDLILYTPYAKYSLFYFDDDSENKVRSVHYLFAVFSFLLIMIGRRNKSLRNNNILFNLNVLAFYTILLVIHQSEGRFVMLFQRLNNYFLFSYLQIIPTLLSSLKRQNNTIVKLILIIFSFAYFIRTIVFNGEKYQLVPYNFDLTLFYSQIP